MKINISIDDISPHPRSNTEVLDRCFEILKEFPETKFTLFIPTRYNRHGEKAYPIGDYPDFCKTIKALPTKSFELGWHGHYHGILGEGSNSEFIRLDYTEAETHFKAMFEEAKRAGLYELFKPIFRPPAFKLSPKSFKAALDLGITTLSLSPKAYAQESHGGAHKEFAGNIVYYNCNPPFDDLKLYAEVIVMYHACQWDKSYLNKEKTQELMAFMRENREVLARCFFEELI